MVLRIIFGVVLAMLLSNLIAAVFVIFRYLIGLGIKSSSVILFYVFAFLVTMGYMIAVSASIIVPSELFYDFSQPPIINVSAISKNAADCAMI